MNDQLEIDQLHKQFHNICYLAGLNKAKIYRIQERFCKKFGLWSFSYATEDQLKIAIEYVKNKYSITE